MVIRNSIWFWVMRYWHGYLCAAQCKWFAHDPAEANATSSFLSLLKSKVVNLLFWSWPTHSVLKKRLLNWHSASHFISCLVGHVWQNIKMHFCPSVRLVILTFCLPPSSVICFVVVVILMTKNVLKMKLQILYIQAICHRGIFICPIAIA